MGRKSEGGGTAIYHIVSVVLVNGITVKCAYTDPCEASYVEGKLHGAMLSDEPRMVLMGSGDVPKTELGANAHKAMFPARSIIAVITDVQDMDPGQVPDGYIEVV